MIYTCSCCKHVEYREFINSYYCTKHGHYMYPGSAQCRDFELEIPITIERNKDKIQEG